MVNSTNTSSFSCSNFDRLHSLGFIRDPYVCKGSPTNGTTKETTGPSSSLSTGAKAGIGLGIGAAVVLFGTLIWWFCFRKKRQQTEQEDVRPADTIPELPQGRHHEMAEASAISLPGELHARSVGEGFQYAVPRGFGSQTGTESQGDVMRNVARRHELQ